MSIRFKHRLEFAALLAVKAIASRLPYRAALGLGWLLAVLGFSLFRYRRAEAVRRIRKVFGESCARDRAERIAWAAFRNFCFTAIESMRGNQITPAWVARHVSDEHVFAVLAARSRDQGGAVFALPHMGSWELAGSACQAMGIPLFSIAARQKNPLFTDYLNRQRDGSGIEILVRGEISFKTVLRNIQSGKYFAILPDVRCPTPALAVPFLGGIANIAAGMALFARQSQAPIFPCILLRHGWTRHTFKLFDPITPDHARPRDEELLRMTRAVFACFDKAIREYPDQWFWFNKRWILDPVEPPAASISRPPP